MTWHLFLILEGSKEPSVEEEAGSSSVSEGGGEPLLGVEGGLPPPCFQASVEQSLWSGVPAYIHQWSSS